MIYHKYIHHIKINNCCNRVPNMIFLYKLSFCNNNNINTYSQLKFQHNSLKCREGVYCVL